ncbi:MAG: hypothetical protein JOZ15_05000, partial [Acidobacteria bacterium]|nr:hypothetical protein [Acidobacteriota bacterium]
DDRPLSETDPIRSYTAAQKNYLEWLRDAAATSFETLRVEDGFLNDAPPRALLYVLLRHALQLSFYDVSLLLHVQAALMGPGELAAARREAPFIHVNTQAAVSESRYQLLYKTEPKITSSPSLRVVDYIVASRDQMVAAAYLTEQLRALAVLTDAPTARLERVLAEHIDCCTYRLDAWLLGLVHCQLVGMRGIAADQPAPSPSPPAGASPGGQGHAALPVPVPVPPPAPRQGIHLGGFSWIENVRPKPRRLLPVELPPDLDAIFNRQGDPPLTSDSTNEGYIHAPSLNQAVAAAVLRNGYLTEASPQNRQTLAVNLTSDRVRIALGLIEGVRGGQSLGALLGYQFERGLHDRHNLAEVDKFIYPIRKQFPLAADRLASTRTPEGVPIEAIEARNVVDGLAFVDYVKSSGNAAYPFGKPLPPATAAEATAIDAEVAAMLDSHDALADLATAEGVFQAVQGNYDRVAATFDAYSKGNFPPQPQVIETPGAGTTLTLRFALQLDAGSDPAVSPIGGQTMTPRAQAQPSLNAWLAKVLPPLDQLGCKVTFVDAATGNAAQGEVTLSELGVQPLDLLFLVHDDSQQAMTELDDRIVQQVVATLSPRPDAGVAILYQERLAAQLSLFELMPLVRSLRRLAFSSRPLRASDLALQNEANQDDALAVDTRRATLPRDAMQAVRASLAAFQAALEGPLSDVANRRGEILADADSYAETVGSLMADAARFGVPQTGWGFAYDWRQRQFRAVLGKVGELVQRWDDHLAQFDALLVAYAALPAGTSTEERFALLRRAERLIATAATQPLPATPDAFAAALTAKRSAFAARRDLFAAIRQTRRTRVADLLADVKALLPVTAFDLVPLAVDAEEQQTIVFAGEVLSLVKGIGANLDRRLAAAQAGLDAYAAAARPVDQVNALQAAAQALLGEDLVLIPQFNLTAAQGDELDQALAASLSGDLFAYLTSTAEIDFPVDTWLYGAA